MSDELVSVYIPTCNRPELLRRAIDSVLRQTHPALEIIVSDDASEAPTRELVERYAAEHPNVLYFRNERRQGPCVTRNRAIFNASGKYITGLDDDDEFMPDRITSFLRSFDPKWSLLASLSIATTPKGTLHWVNRPTRVVTLDDMLYYNRIGNQVFTLTERMRAVGGFDSRYRAIEDYELWTRLIDEFGPALRLGLHTQHIHHDHQHHRVSLGKDVGQACLDYVTDFGHLMGPGHRKAQEFFRKSYDPALRSPGLLDVVSLLGSPVFREAAGSYAFGEYPELVNRISRLRRWLSADQRADEPSPRALRASSRDKLQSLPR